MQRTTYECKICGWKGLPYQHGGAVDCIAEYRRLVDELRGLLPKGKQVLLASLERHSEARVWIDGPITNGALTRLITLIEFMREAWGEDAPAPTQEAPECLSISDDTLGGQVS